ncbi:hypothetical protein [Burkholderia ubonensis]|uniref:hypothetical protein n=1 Tax=Burkholderia ubonensis TaxID=101571 RepID=UPI00387EE069
MRVKARGYRNKTRFKAAILFHYGNLDMRACLNLIGVAYMGIEYIKQTSADDIESILEKFVELYVRSEFRSRFLHEAKKKPGQLYGRICHRIDQIFEDRLKSGPMSLPQSGEYLALHNSGFVVETWSAFNAYTMLASGGLIISHGGSWFWARSEPEMRVPGIDYHAPAD